MAWIGGADGSKGGWLAVLQDTETGDVRCRGVKRFAELLEMPVRPSLLAVDIPIGLQENSEPRRCDVEARSLLGTRGSTVFPAPLRQVLDADSYESANAITRKIAHRGLPRQAFALVPKIREVDQAVRSLPSGTSVREAHPELAFYSLNGKVPLPSKHSAWGLIERRRLLSAVSRQLLEQAETQVSVLQGVGLDDLYDALALLETARKLREGSASSVPKEPPIGRDRYNLPMEIMF